MKAEERIKNYLNFKLLYAAARFLPSGGPIVTIYTWVLFWVNCELFSDIRQAVGDVFTFSADQMDADKQTNWKRRDKENKKNWVELHWGISVSVSPRGLSEDRRVLTRKHTDAHSYFK